MTGELNITGSKEFDLELGFILGPFLTKMVPIIKQFRKCFINKWPLVLNPPLEGLRVPPLPNEVDKGQKRGEIDIKR